MEKDNVDNYAAFEYSATQLSAFLFSIDEFIISLKNGIIIRFTPVNIEDFRQWLLRHKIRDVSIGLLPAMRE